MSKPTFEISIYDYITVNGRISKKLFEKVVMPKLIELENLKFQKQKLLEGLRFYGNPESWIKRKGEAWNKSSPVEKGDDEMIRNYKHPEKDWVGTVVVGGKLARDILEEIEND